MQRDIKFRAWAKYGEMFPNVQNHLGEDKWAFGNMLISDEFVIMQFTGLKDKNGVEIYEGDLIKATSRENPSESMAIFKVHYDQVYGSFVGHVVKKIFPVLSPSNWAIGELRFDAEVIGNIYENPELLGETK